MATGKYQITLDSDDFVSGMTTSSNLTDGGFSPETDAINVVANPGVLYPPDQATNVGSLGAGANIIAVCNDDSGIVPTTSTNTVDKFILTDGGVLYVLKGGILTSVLTGAIDSSVAILGLVDMQVFGSPNTNQIYIFITHRIFAGHCVSYIIYDYSTGLTVSTSYLDSFVSNWIPNAAHPMLVYNKLLYIANGPYLATYDGSTQSPSVLSLSNSNWITAMQIDPGTGNMMLGLATGDALAFGSIANQQNAPAFIGLYDGVNPTQLQRKVPVDSIIYSFRACGSVMYIFYGDSVGIWNGNGIGFLRKRYSANVGYQTGNIYKLKSTNIDNVLFFVSNKNKPNKYLTGNTFHITAFGEVQSGKKAFFNIINSSGIQIDCVFSVTNDHIYYSANSVLYSLPLYTHAGVFSTGDNSPIYISKRYAFPRPCTINQVRIFYEDMVSAGSGTLGNLAVIDDNRGVAFNQDISNPSAGVTTAWIDVYPNIISTEFQLKYWWKETSTNHGIQKIMVFYTSIE